MIVNITKSKLFTTDPDVRFSKEYSVPNGVWIEAWRRYKLLDYSTSDLKDFIFVKYARNLEYPTLGRWIFRSEIYSITAPLIKRGVECVNSEIFGSFEEKVMNELIKSLKEGSTTDSTIII